MKYNVAGGQVVVRSQRLDAQTLELRVLDTGLGLDEAQRAELFQPFNRLGREQSDTEGTGIGLVISRRLAELMAGTLTAESAAGVGATFVLRLPLASLQAPRPELLRNKRRAAPSVSPPPRGADAARRWPWGRSQRR